MRNRILAIAAIAGAMAAPIAAQAQSTVTTGVVRGGTVVINDDEGIAVDSGRHSVNMSCANGCRPTPFRIASSSAACCRKPASPITTCRRPMASTPYRYTVVNGQTVLVEPRSRRIVQVVE